MEHHLLSNIRVFILRRSDVVLKFYVDQFGLNCEVAWFFREYIVVLVFYKVDTFTPSSQFGI
jgi:hypothetical protein